jgi:hypothetical protein
MMRVALVGRSRHLSTKRGYLVSRAFTETAARFIGAAGVRLVQPLRTLSDRPRVILDSRGPSAAEGVLRPRRSRRGYFSSRESIRRLTWAPTGRRGPGSPIAERRGSRAYARARVHPCEKGTWKAGINSLSDYPVRAKALTVVREPHL